MLYNPSQAQQDQTPSAQTGHHVAPRATIPFEKPKTPPGDEQFLGAAATQCEQRLLPAHINAFKFISDAQKLLQPGINGSFNEKFTQNITK